jgi:hypothetical protein
MNRVPVSTFRQGFSYQMHFVIVPPHFGRNSYDSDFPPRRSRTAPDLHLPFILC